MTAGYPVTRDETLRIENFKNVMHRRLDSFERQFKKILNGELMMRTRSVNKKIFQIMVNTMHGFSLTDDTDANTFNDYLLDGLLFIFMFSL